MATRVIGSIIGTLNSGVESVLLNPETTIVDQNEGKKVLNKEERVNSRQKRLQESTKLSKKIGFKTRGPTDRDKSLNKLHEKKYAKYNAHTLVKILPTIVGEGAKISAKAAEVEGHPGISTGGQINCQLLEGNFWR